MPCAKRRSQHAAHRSLPVVAGRARSRGMTMSDAAAAQRQFGESVTSSDVAGLQGPLARAAAVVYTLPVVELLLLLTTAPGLILLILLDRDASNVPLAAA